MCEEKSKFAEQLALSFHEQFAQNQNHHQRMFVQVLAVLITVLVGFGYAYTGLQNRSSDGGNAVNMEFDMLYASLMISMVLLSLAIALIVNMAYGFRRDQTTACRIRVNAGAMMAGEDSNKPGIYFPAAYNPVNPVGEPGRCWMPEYHNIFFIALIAIKIVLIFIVIIKVCSIDSLDKHGFFYFLIFAAFFSTGFDFWVRCLYKKKWKGVAENAQKILQSKSKDDTQVGSVLGRK